jgi:hypothetical protein
VKQHNLNSSVIRDITVITVVVFQIIVGIINQQIMSAKMKIHEWLVQCTHVIAEDRRDKLLGSLALLLAKKNQRIKKKKRFWVAPIFKNRCEHGFYHALLPTLKLEDLRFHNYFRMSTIQYEELLAIVGPHLEKQYVVREPISATERLTLTLR